jgi:hypothetical protein
MSTWKLSIKPAAEAGFDPFDLCQKKSLVGVGWSYVFEGRNIVTKQDSYQALREKEGKVPRHVERLLDEVKVGDFIWLHQSGGYFLCKIKDDICVLGPQMTDDFAKYDLGHARNAEWVKVPELLVPGRVQRTTIVQRTIQRMDCSEMQEKSFEYLHCQLSKTPDWFPTIDEKKVADKLISCSSEELRDLLTPDDYEDIVAAFLQFKGWTLIKSTYFRTKPEFEFLVVRSGPMYGHVQVKSGGVQLCPLNYREWVNDKECVFLFSTHPTPYPGSPVDGVHTLNANEVIEWAVKKNTWVLSPGLKLQLQLL